MCRHARRDTYMNKNLWETKGGERREGGGLVCKVSSSQVYGTSGRALLMLGRDNRNPPRKWKVDTPLSQGGILTLKEASNYV